jgi:hypothetical protein
MATLEQIRDMKLDLSKYGVDGGILDDWPAQLTCYRHKPGLSAGGKLAFAVNSMLPNQPNTPDSLTRLASRGIIPYQASPTCGCVWCHARHWETTDLMDDGTYVERNPINYKHTKVFTVEEVEARQEAKARDLKALKPKTREAMVVEANAADQRERDVELMTKIAVKTGPFRASCDDCGWKGAKEYKTLKIASASLKRHRTISKNHKVEATPTETSSLGDSDVIHHGTPVVRDGETNGDGQKASPGDERGTA